MGNFCPCLKVQEDEGESSRLNNKSAPEELLSGKQNPSPNYQAVIEEAHRKFLNSSFVRRVPVSSDAEAVRSKLLNANIPSTVFTSPKRTKSFTGFEAPTSQGIIDILSMPIQIFNQDVLVDEMAELVARQTFNLRKDDSNSTVASFKPVFT